MLGIGSVALPAASFIYNTVCVLTGQRMVCSVWCRDQDFATGEINNNTSRRMERDQGQLTDLPEVWGIKNRLQPTAEREKTDTDRPA